MADTEFTDLASDDTLLSTDQIYFFDVVAGQLKRAEIGDLVAAGLAGVGASGTWTPTIIGTTTAGSHTYTTRAGVSLKQGPLVHAWFEVTIDTLDGNIAGNVQIDGLPFAVRAQSFNFQSGEARWVNLNGEVAGVELAAIQNSTRIQVTRALLSAAGSSGVMPVSNLQSGTSIRGMVSYLTD